MRRQRNFIVALVLALACCAVMVAVVLQNSTLFADAVVQEQQDETITPVADFDAAEPSDPDAKALRRKRNGRHDYSGNAADAATFVLGESSPPIALDLPPNDGAQESAIPAQSSDAVVIGKVTDARAYLSNDKTAVYSEFSVTLEEVLSDNTTASLSAGAVITAERRGGSVRLPSGKMLVRGALGRTMPRVERRYVLFLKRNEEADTYSIITGYELRAGKVIPLDGLSKKSRQLDAYAAYKDADEASFLTQVRQAIVARAGMGQAQGRRLLTDPLPEHSRS
jgi:hypothetical protein